MGEITRVRAAKPPATRSGSAGGRQDGAQEHSRELEVFVVYTSVSSTLKALRAAAKLAIGLSARIRLLVLHVVPYPLPLDEPAVAPPVIEQRFRTLVEDARVDTAVDIRLCRDPAAALQQALPPQSVVVIGGRSRLADGGAVRFYWKSLWPTREERMAEQLRQAGHHVVFPDALEVIHA